MNRWGRSLGPACSGLLLVASCSHDDASHLVATVAPDPVSGLHANLADRGVTLSEPGAPWNATLAGARVGCAGGAMAPIERTGAPRASGVHRVEYPGQAAGNEVDAWYERGARGVEQGFTLASSPCPGSGGDVIVEVSLEGLTAQAAPDGEGLVLRDSSGRTRLRYGELAARDANGASLPVSMQPMQGAIALHVDTRGAAFPVVVDPLAWLPVATLAATGNATLGGPVAVSGTTAIVGAANAAAYVFTQSGTTWTQQQVIALPGSPTAIALSGTTAIIGTAYLAVGSNNYQGAAFVYTLTGSTWTLQQELTATGGAAGDYFGSSVGLTGAMAIVGADGVSSSQGAAYVFTRSGTTWTQQQKLTASDAATDVLFGSSLSIDGTSALIGSPRASGTEGAVYVFTSSGASWTQQAELTSIGSAGLGTSVALSGATALVGAYGPSDGTGYAHVFARSGTTWTEQPSLGVEVGTDGTSSWTALSGTTAVVGAPNVGQGLAGQGLAYVFTQSGTTWSRQQQLSNPGLGDSFGGAVAISGGTVFVGSTASVVAYQFLPADGSTCSAGTDCGSGFCVGGVCCNSTCGPCGDCSTGQCTFLAKGSPGTPTCSPGLCSGSSATCGGCTADAGCVAGNYCQGGQCVPQLATGGVCTADDQCIGGSCVQGACHGIVDSGSACTNADQCSSQQCVDGVCCNEACVGQCQACDIPSSVGTCTAITGDPHGARPACGGTGVCSGTCDGANQASCTYPGDATSCPTTCSGVSIATNHCDGLGGCVPSDTELCPNGLACDQDAGACLAKCTPGSTDGCQAAYVCNSSGVCVVPPSSSGGSTSSGGCSIAEAPDGRAGGTGLAGLAGFAFVAGRVRARRRRSRTLRGEV